MTEQLYPLYTSVHREKVIFLPEHFDQLPKTTVVFGSKREEAKVKKVPKGKSGIILSKTLQEALHIPQIPLKLHIIVNGDECFLGPIVGIFTAGFKNFSQAPLGQRSFYFAKLLSAGETTGVLPVVFGIQHIHWEEGLVTGFVYDKRDNQWQTVTLPLPNVIYDRIPNRRIEQLEQVQTVKHKLRHEYAIPWFNPGFFNKWDLYQHLSKDVRIQSLLPDTILFQRKDDLQRMLEQYDHVYVKWVHGSLGKGIYEIKRASKDSVDCFFRDEEGDLRSLSRIGINNLIREFFPDFQEEEYMIQQGIELIHHEEKPVDFRLHMNKRKDSSWIVTALAAKVSGKNSPTTHLNSGGEIKTVAELFPNHGERETVIQQLTETALLVCETLEKQTGSFLGEIGLDIGIDRAGNIWLIEANAKPGRSIFSHPRLHVLERKNHILLFNYATTLSALMFKNPGAMIGRMDSCTKLPVLLS